MYSSGGDGGSDSNNDILSYKKEWSSLSELMTNYWLERWNDIISKKGISKLGGPLRGYHHSSV